MKKKVTNQGKVQENSGSKNKINEKFELMKKKSTCAKVSLCAYLTFTYFFKFSSQFDNNCLEL